MMEAEAAAIRAALEKLDELQALLENANIWDEDAHRPIERARRYLTQLLRERELALWTLTGLPEVPPR